MHLFSRHGTCCDQFLIQPGECMNRINQVLRISLITLMLSLLCSFAQAVPITYTATNFKSHFEFGPPAPQQTVIAKFDYSSDIFGVFTLNSFEMTILDKTYSLGDIAYEQSAHILTIGGPESGIWGGSLGTNDFYLSFNSLHLWNGFMSYTIEADKNNLWWTEASAEISSVPEPTSITLLVLALAGFRFSRSNRKQG